MDFLGNELTQICDKTEQELKDCVKNETCGTWAGTPDTLRYCNYYNVDDPKFCWVIDGLYRGSMSEKFVNCWYRSGISKIKVACDTTCGNWYTRRKATYKPTGSILFSNITLRRAICGDTAIAFKTLAPFIIKNTVDSLVVLQYTQNSITWY